MSTGNLSPGVLGAIYVGVLVVALLAINLVVRWLYCPRSFRDWRMLLRDAEYRGKLRSRKKRLDAIKNRRPGSILPGIPTSMRDFALEPLIRNGQFKAARNYIMEQIRRQRDAPEGTGRMSVYVQYLDLIEGAR